MNIYKNLFLTFLVMIFSTSVNAKSKEIINSPQYLNKTNQQITLHIRSLLKSKKYSELNDLLNDYQLKTKENIENEEDLFTAYNAFRINDKSYFDMLNSWIESTPHSYQPYLARAKYYYNQGWIKRGRKWASETKKKNIEEMKKVFQNAYDDIDKVLEIDKSVTEVYTLMIALNMTLGKNQETARAVEQGLKYNPLSYFIRLGYLKSLSPRWNNSPKTSLLFIMNSHKYQNDNPRLKFLEGFISMDKADRLTLSDNYNLAEKSYNLALKAGENHEVTHRKGKNYYWQKNYRKAIEYQSRAIELYSENADYFLYRSKAYYNSGYFDNAANDLIIANKLKPKDKSILRLKKWMVSRFKKKGYKNIKKIKIETALNFFNLALSLNPKSANSYFGRARANMKRTQYAPALIDLEKAVKLRPSSFKYVRNIDYLLAKKGKWDQIIQHWNNYIERNPNDSQGYLERGGAYFHKHDIKASLKDLKFSADMGNADAKRLYKRYKNLR